MSRSTRATLKFEIVGDGWALCTVVINEVVLTVSASYLSDALYDLTSMFVAFASGHPNPSCEFAEEPGEFRWVLERISTERLRLRIYSFPVLNWTASNDEGTIVFDQECGCRTLLDAMLASLAVVRSTYTEQTFLETWGHPFPASKMEELAKLLRDGDPQ